MTKTRLFVIGLMLLAACAPGTNILATPPAEVAGFWLGLWHGIISCFTLIASAFTDSVSMYEVHNNGWWYNFGFFLGFGSLTASSSRSSR